MSRLSNKCQVLDINLICEIISASNLLIENTNENDILIFLGQSPDYLANIVKNNRNVISIPISGRAFSDKYSIPKKENLDNYCGLLHDLGLSKKIIEKNNIIFIDHSHSGESITSFAKLILRCFNLICKYSTNLDEKNRCFNFINIVDYKQWPDSIFNPDYNYINTIGYILMPNLVAFANEGKPNQSQYNIPRTIPHYPHWKWNLPLDYSQVDNGKICLLKLKLYYDFFNVYVEICKNIEKQSKKTLIYFKDLLLDIIIDEKDILYLNNINNTLPQNEICEILQNIFNKYFSNKATFYKYKYSKYKYSKYNRL